MKSTPIFEVTSSSEAPITMSSREIAILCEKRHDHVMEDITKMLNSLDGHVPEKSGTYTTTKGNTYKCFNLPKRECLILVSGYSVKLRARIIDRWMELEAKESLPREEATDTSGDLIKQSAETVALLNVVEISARLGDWAQSSRRKVNYRIVKAKCPEALPYMPTEAINSPDGGDSADSSAALSTFLMSYAVTSKNDDFDLSVRAINTHLESAGFLRKQHRKSSRGTKHYWVVTEQGLHYGLNIISVHNESETQPKWYHRKFQKLIHACGLTLYRK